jgi:hypothetical protein
MYGTVTLPEPRFIDRLHHPIDLNSHISQRRPRAP